MLELAYDFWFSVLFATLFASGVALIVLYPVARKPVDGKPKRTSGVAVIFHDGEVTDATPLAKKLLSDQSDVGSHWGDATASLRRRFTGLPQDYSQALANAPASYKSAVSGDAATLELELTGQTLRLTLLQFEGEDCPVLFHHALVDQLELKYQTKISQHAPYPIWYMQHDKGDAVLWSNPAYQTLAKARGLQNQLPKPAPIFDEDLTDLKTGGRQRVLVKDGESNFWFDLSATKLGSGWICYAQEVTASVQAEKGQRSFIQTLTKTFAQLGTGLAIFDRHRRLTLFNPALVDLTQLPAEFLSSRPSLAGFFDRLRDTRIMPEPRNYTEWREQLNSLNDERSDRSFSELWSLSNGLSYRVFGRPHPDGSVAFLIEDVTAELSLTRNFVRELEINQALFDTLHQGIVVFSSAGDLLYANKSYQALWGDDPEADLTPTNLRDAISLWSKSCEPSELWGQLLSRPTGSGKDDTFGGQIKLLDGTQAECRRLDLGKGASAVTFGFIETTSNLDMMKDDGVLA